MTDSGKRASRAKAASVGSPKQTKNGKKSGASSRSKKSSPAADWKDTVKIPGAVLTGKILSDLIDSLCEEISNVLFDVIKEGWLEAGPLLADILQNMSITQYLALVHQGREIEESKLRDEYDSWMNSLLSAAVIFSKRVNELKRQIGEAKVSEREICDFVANEIVVRMGTQHTLDSEEFMRLTAIYCFKRTLELSLPPKAKISRRKVAI